MHICKHTCIYFLNGGQYILDWNLNYAALIEYGKEYGNCNVPTRKHYECILTGNGANGSDHKYSGKLGTWLCNQKRKKRGSYGNLTLSLDHETLLQSLVDEGALFYLYSDI